MIEIIIKEDLTVFSCYVKICLKIYNFERKNIGKKKSRMISKDLEEKLNQIEIEEIYKIKKNTI